MSPRAARIGYLAVEPLEEERYRHLHRRRDVPNEAGVDTVRPGLVFPDLLELDANTVAKLPLGHSQRPAAMADPPPNMNIYWMSHT